MWNSDVIFTVHGLTKPSIKGTYLRPEGCRAPNNGPLPKTCNLSKPRLLKRWIALFTGYITI